MSVNRHAGGVRDARVGWCAVRKLSLSLVLALMGCGFVLSSAASCQRGYYSEELYLDGRPRESDTRTTHRPATNVPHPELTLLDPESKRELDAWRKSKAVVASGADSAS